MKLFFVLARDPDGDKLPHFITATTAEEALTMWRRNLIGTDDDDDDGQDTPMTDYVVSVFEVPATAKVRRIHRWQQDRVSRADVTAADSTASGEVRSCITLWKDGIITKD
jgi:hypothetical protein